MSMLHINNKAISLLLIGFLVGLFVACNSESQDTADDDGDVDVMEDDVELCDYDYVPPLDESIMDLCTICFWGVKTYYKERLSGPCVDSTDCAVYLDDLQECLDRSCVGPDIDWCVEGYMYKHQGCVPKIFEDGSLGWSGDCPLNGSRMLCVNDTNDKCALSDYCDGCYFSSATISSFTTNNEISRPHRAFNTPETTDFDPSQYFPAGNMNELWPYGGAYAFPVGVNEPICADLDCRICTPVDPCPDGYTCAARHRGAASAMAYDEMNYLIGYCVKDANVGCLNLEDCPGDPFCKGQYCGISWREGTEGREAYSTCKTHGYDPDYYTCQLLDLYPDLVNEHVVVCDGSATANAKPECAE